MASLSCSSGRESFSYQCEATSIEQPASGSVSSSSSSASHWQPGTTTPTPTHALSRAMNGKEGGHTSHIVMIRRCSSCCGPLSDGPNIASRQQPTPSQAPPSNHQLSIIFNGQHKFCIAPQTRKLRRRNFWPASQRIMLAFIMPLLMTHLSAVSFPLQLPLTSANGSSHFLPTSTKLEKSLANSSIMLENVTLSTASSHGLAQRSADSGTGCPKSFHHTSGARDPCDCYRFDEGLSIECSDTNWREVQNILNLTQNFKDDQTGSNIPIRSLSILKLSVNDSHLLPIIGGKSLEHLHISDSDLMSIAENAFSEVTELKSLELVGGMLTSVPPAISKLKRLEKLDLESNRIRAIDAYAFHGLPLIQLSLAANQVVLLKEYSFAGLEDWLEELILSSNKITRFPLSALRKLRKLRILKLAWNEINELPEDGTRLMSLEALDLSGNAIWHLEEHTFITMPQLRMLDLSHNRIQSLNSHHFPPSLQRLALSGSQIESIDQQTFKELKQLVALDLSDNPLRKFDFVQYLPGQLAVLSLARVDMSTIHEGQKELIEQLSTRVERLDVSGARLDRKNRADLELANDTNRCESVRTQAYTDMLEIPLFTQGVIAGSVVCFSFMSVILLILIIERWQTRRKQRRPVKPADQKPTSQHNQTGGSCERSVDQLHSQSQQYQLANSQYSTIQLGTLSHQHQQQAHMNSHPSQYHLSGTAQHLPHPHPDEFIPSAFRHYTLAPLPTSPSFHTVADMNNLQVQQQMSEGNTEIALTPHDPLPPPPLNTVTLVGWTERTAI